MYPQLHLWYDANLHGNSYQACHDSRNANLNSPSCTGGFSRATRGCAGRAARASRGRGTTGGSWYGRVAGAAGRVSARRAGCMDTGGSIGGGDGGGCSAQN